MASLADVTARDAVRALERAGWMVLRQKGSHVVLGKPGEYYRLVLPDHGSRPLRRGTLLAAIRRAGLTPEEFLRLV
ncbi:YcfA-like protein [mine drainage metagenome]|uniref:YcfA-like protein n=1 Tax=mine drainage metagenome TaxID=410659 RepID=T1AB89_9ZZZZ